MMTCTYQNTYQDVGYSPLQVFSTTGRPSITIRKELLTVNVSSVGFSLRARGRVSNNQPCLYNKVIDKVHAQQIPVNRERDQQHAGGVWMMPEIGADKTDTFDMSNDQHIPDHIGKGE